jgi:hypothetical protein
MDGWTLLHRTSDVRQKKDMGWDAWGRRRRRWMVGEWLGFVHGRNWRFIFLTARLAHTAMHAPAKRWEATHHKSINLFR